MTCVASAWSYQAHAQTVDVTARVEITSRTPHASHQDSSNAVLWLTPLQPITADTPIRKPQEFKLAQKDKQFTPHILVVPVGSSVNFPNLDPFFHNVFSLFNGKRFDLGLYEGHTNRTVQFDREGVSFIFCNIHPNMGAVVISLATPFYGVSARDGGLVLHDVPPGRYRLNVWAENVPIERLNALSRVVEVSQQWNRLDTQRLETSGDFMNHHENKFGEAYTAQPKDSY